MIRLAFVMFFVLHLSLGQIVQLSPEKEEFWSRLEQFAEAAGKQLSDKPIPEVKQWSLQRIKTIQTLNELQQKLDNVCFYASCGKAAGSGMGIMCALTSLAATIMGLIGGLLPLSIITAGGFICPTAYFTKEVSSTYEQIMSKKYQSDLQDVLIKDKKISYPLKEWLKYSSNLEVEVQNILGFDLKSEISINVKVLNEFSRLLGLTKNFEKSILLIKGSKYSSSLGNSIGINALRLFSQRMLGSAHIAKKIQLSLAILSVMVDATRIYENVAGIPSAISFINDKFDVKIPPAVKITASILLDLLNLKIEIQTFIDAIEIIKEGKCPYSDGLKHVIDMLHLDLTFIDSISR